MLGWLRRRWDAWREMFHVKHDLGYLEPYQDWPDDTWFLSYSADCDAGKHLHCHLFADDDPCACPCHRPRELNVA